MCSNDDIYKITYDDLNCFLFSLRSNKRLKQPITFPINQQYSNHSFSIYSPLEYTLFSFGKNDIVIRKYNERMNSSCFQSSFNYHELKDVFIPQKQTETFFTVKRIQLYQMIETPEMKEKRLKERQQKYQNERVQLDKVNKQLFLEYNTEITHLETVTGLRLKRTLFDSQICQWNTSKSTFDTHLLNTKNCAFLIENTTDEIFCVFISVKIDTFEFVNPITKMYEGVCDSDTLFFHFAKGEELKISVKNSTKNEMKKCYKMKDFGEEKNSVNFHLCKTQKPSLFAVGKNGEYYLWIGKKEFQSYYLSEREKEKVFFDVKRIVVFEFY